MTTTENTKAREVRTKLERWLRADEWNVSVESHKEAIWVLHAKRDEQRMIFALGPKRPEVIEISSGISISGDHQQKLAALPFETLNPFLCDLTIDLLGRDLEVNLIGEPLEQIWMHSRICLDGLSQDNFLQRLQRVENAARITIRRIGKLLGEGFSGLSEKGELPGYAN